MWQLRAAEGHAPIHVLMRADCLSDAPLAIATNVVAERKLDKQAMDVFVVVEPANSSHDGMLVVLCCKLDVRRADASLGRCLDLHPHVRRRVAASALLDDGEVRLEAGELALDLLDALRDVCAQVSASATKLRASAFR